MKRYTQLFTFFVVLCLVLCVTGCGNDEPEVSEQERVSALLENGVWKVSTVKVDGVDKTPLFTGLTVDFNGTAFSTANGKIVWPANGTWNFTNADAKAFTRSDGVTVNIDQVTDSNLELTFPWASSTYGPGRVSSVAGSHVFTFTK